ncbi:SAM-dependent methyltransferase [Glutamicibacter uratoxydans]|uniref:SAM-dependent methyltransferase n=1 Tax=Glutamicibacter uratoxydans TaxID=43667 RepID=A0A4Y4DJJ6_GLUUR|nr:methyltransferase domain-containing protein [Glutamicibacter uratoxydans]GED04733.1 SAM-dependent methyltransferase [Glutamicibacter uratoxydans]
MSEATSITCPVCEAQLERAGTAGRSLQCPEGHRFDAAKQGYFNFLTGKGTNFLEDTAAMVMAREAFQQRGHYAALAGLLADLAGEHHHGARLDILDAGAGTGYYLGEILRGHPSEQQDAIAVDISRYAMRRAAKLPATTAIVWDVWRRLPTADASRDIVLNCFAPHNPSEFRRILRPGGLCIVVTGAPDHLEQVRTELGMLNIAQGKQESLVEKFAAAGLVHQGSQNLNYSMALDSEDLFNLAFMGPAGHHLDPEVLRRATDSLQQRDVNASFDVHLFALQP